MYESLIARAHAAGVAALQAATPKPMLVVGGRPGEEPQRWVVPEGPCGFAWIKLSGRGKFARWAVENHVASLAYPSGIQIWVGEGGQSIARKEAYADAYAAVLREAGIEARAESRLD